MQSILHIGAYFNFSLLLFPVYRFSNHCDSATLSCRLFKASNGNVMKYTKSILVCESSGFMLCLQCKEQPLRAHKYISAMRKSAMTIKEAACDKDLKDQMCCGLEERKKEKHLRIGFKKPQDCR